MITYSIEPVSVIFDEGAGLLRDHYFEIEGSKVPLDPDIDGYMKLEEIGALLTITVRFNGVLIGYSVWLISKYLHSKSYVYATNDAIFIEKKHRKHTIGTNLIKESERILHERGANKVMISSKKDSTLDKLLNKLGYSHNENVHVKE